MNDAQSWISVSWMPGRGLRYLAQVTQNPYQIGKAKDKNKPQSSWLNLRRHLHSVVWHRSKLAVEGGFWIFYTLKQKWIKTDYCLNIWSVRILTPITPESGLHVSVAMFLKTANKQPTGMALTGMVFWLSLRSTLFWWHLGVFPSIACDAWASALLVPPAGRYSIWMWWFLRHGGPPHPPQNPTNKGVSWCFFMDTVNSPPIFGFLGLGTQKITQTCLHAI